MRPNKKIAHRDIMRKYIKYINLYFIFASVFISSTAFSQTIAEDIQALSQFSRETQLAAYRLVDAGTAILPEAHSALLNENSNLKLIMQLVTVLGQIGDPSSIGPIIQVAQKHPDNQFIYQNALLAFALMPQTQETFKFAAAQLDNERPIMIQRTALWYFAKHKDMRAKKWIDKYALKETKPKLRDAALVLASKLGDPRAKPVIVKMLHQKQKIAITNNLLMALAELVKPDEFQSLTTMFNNKSPVYRSMLSSMLRRCKFKWGTRQEKLSLAKTMLKSRSAEEVRMAIRYSLEQGVDDNLKALMKVDSKSPSPYKKYNPMRVFIIGEARRNNYKVVEHGQDVIFEKIKNN